MENKLYFLKKIENDIYMVWLLTFETELTNSSIFKHIICQQSNLFSFDKVVEKYILITTYCKNEMFLRELRSSFQYFFFKHESQDSIEYFQTC